MSTIEVFIRMAQHNNECNKVNNACKFTKTMKYKLYFLYVILFSGIIYHIITK